MRSQLPFDLLSSSYQYSSIQSVESSSEGEKVDSRERAVHTNSSSNFERTKQTPCSRAVLAALLLALLVVSFTVTLGVGAGAGPLEGAKRVDTLGYSSGDRVFVKIRRAGEGEAGDFRYLRVNENGRIVTDRVRYQHGGLFELYQEGVSNGSRREAVWGVKSVATGERLYVEAGALAAGKVATKVSSAELIMARPSAGADGEPPAKATLLWYADGKSVCVDARSQVVVDSAAECLIELERFVPIKGVNLGSWMIPEYWLSPEPYEGLDPYYGEPCGLVMEVGMEEADRRMQEHLSTWLTEADFDEVARLGFNSVRIPVGYWNIIPDPYDIFSPSDVQVSLEHLDWAFDAAQERGLSVLLDLHGLPGSQNALEHSGCGYAGILWHEGANVNLSLSTIAAMVDRYADRDNLLGIEIINEPSEAEDIAHRKELVEYYSEAYRIIRGSSDSLLVVISELWSNQYDSWSLFFDERHYHNVVMDWHLYNWDAEDGESDHLARAQTWSNFVQTFITKYPMIIGEVCLDIHISHFPLRSLIRISFFSGASPRAC